MTEGREVARERKSFVMIRQSNLCKFFFRFPHLSLSDVTVTYRREFLYKQTCEIGAPLRDDQRNTMDVVQQALNHFESDIGR